MSEDTDFIDPIEIQNRDRLKSLHITITTIFPIATIILAFVAGWSFFGMFYYQNMHYNIAQMIYNGMVCCSCIVVILMLVVGYAFINIMVQLEGKT